MIEPTPVINASKLAALIGADAIYLKTERAHPTGTHKLRAARFVIQQAIQNRFAAVTVGSCGNYGVAIALESARNGLKCDVFIPAGFESSRKGEMQQYNAEVRIIDGTYEDAVDISRSFARQFGAYDCNVGGAADSLIQKAYSAIADEAKFQAPGITAAWIPVGDGTTITGVYKGFQANCESPKMYAVSSLGNNAACASITAKKVVELEPSKVRPNPINEPLVNWRSIHAKEVIQLVCESGGAGFEVNDTQLIEAAKKISALAAINSTPTGAAGFAGLCAAPRHMQTGSHLVLITA